MRRGVKLNFQMFMLKRLSQRIVQTLSEGVDLETANWELNLNSKMCQIKMFSKFDT